MCRPLPAAICRHEVHPAAVSESQDPALWCPDTQAPDALAPLQLLEQSLPHIHAPTHTVDFSSSWPGMLTTSPEGIFHLLLSHAGVQRYIHAQALLPLQQLAHISWSLWQATHTEVSGTHTSSSVLQPFGQLTPRSPSLTQHNAQEQSQVHTLSLTPVAGIQTCRQKHMLGPFTQGNS